MSHSAIFVFFDIEAVRPKFALVVDGRLVDPQDVSVIVVKLDPWQGGQESDCHQLRRDSMTLKSLVRKCRCIDD